MNTEDFRDKNTINLLIGGEAGQGVTTVGLILAKSLVRSGYHIVVTQTYESRIRGGHNAFVIRASTNNVVAPQESIDLLVALNREAVELHADALSPQGAVVADVAFATDTIGEEMWRPMGKGSIRLHNKRLIITQSLLGFKLMEQSLRK